MLTPKDRHSKDLKGAPDQHGDVLCGPNVFNVWPNESVKVKMSQDEDPGIRYWAIEAMRYHEPLRAPKRHVAEDAWLKPFLQ